MFVSNRITGPIDNIANLKTYQVGVIEAAAHRALRQHKDSLLKGYGLTGVDWYLIGAVADSGKEGIRATDLAKLLGTTMGFLTKTVALLEAKNILTRVANAKDARSSYIVLNTSYVTTVDEIEVELRKKLRQSVYNLITPEELLVYIQVINKFAAIKTNK